MHTAENWLKKYTTGEEYSNTEKVRKCIQEHRLYYRYILNFTTRFQLNILIAYSMLSFALRVPHTHIHTGIRRRANSCPIPILPTTLIPLANGAGG